MRKSVWLLVTCAALAGCSGGGSAGGGSGTVVVPTPTPSPASPTPTPLTTGEVKPAAGATFISATMTLTTTGGTSQTNGVITGGTTSARVTTFDTPGFAASYGPSAGYSLSDSVNSAAFASAQLASDDTAPNGNGTVVFARSAGSSVDYLALYQRTAYSSVSGYSAAQYGGSAGWQHTVSSGTSGQTRLDYFAYGPATPVGAMPHSGVVRYAMLSSGNYATDTDLLFLTAQSGAFLTVDFAAGTVSGTLPLAGQNFYKNVTGGIGSIPLAGSFTGNSTTGPVSASLGVIAGVPGQFRLVFVGPAANEVIITYVAGDGTQTAVGAAVGISVP